MTFTRDGHLLDLAIQRHLIEPEADVEAHAAACQACALRLEQATAAHQEPLPELDLSPRAEVIPFPTRRVLGGLLTVAAMAAGALLVLRSGPTDGPDAPEQFTFRGDGFELEVHRQTEEGSEPLKARAPVREGDRLGFRVGAREPGFLLVGGVDGADQAYPVFPRGSEPSADPFEAGAPRTLDVGLELDATPGQEHLVAALCQHPLGWRTLEAHLTADAPLPQDCVTRELTLEKEAP